MAKHRLTDDKVRLIAQEIGFRTKAETLTDGELSLELIEKLWTRIPMWSWEGVLLDEAITRLKHADTRRRWQERKAQRAARAEGRA